MRSLAFALLLCCLVVAIGCDHGNELTGTPAGHTKTIGVQHNRLLSLIDERLGCPADGSVAPSAFILVSCNASRELGNESCDVGIDNGLRVRFIKALLHDAVLMKKRGLLDPFHGQILNGRGLVTALVNGGALTAREGWWLQGLIDHQLCGKEQGVSAITALDQYRKEHPLPRRSAVLAAFLDVAICSAQYWTGRDPGKRLGFDNLIDGIGGIVGSAIGRWFTHGNSSGGDWGQLIGSAVFSSLPAVVEGAADEYGTYMDGFFFSNGLPPGWWDNGGADHDTL